MSIGDILSIAKTALLTTEDALRTTAHNIANVNTPGYSRQRVNLNTGISLNDGSHIFGTGVVVDNIERVYDQFLQTQITDATSTNSMYEAKYGSLIRLEGIYNDTKGLGLEDALNGFFMALEDVNNDPQSYAARSALLSKAETLADRVRSLDQRTKYEITGVDTQIKAAVDDINVLTDEIAELNNRIIGLENIGQEANDLRDERDRKILKLAEFIDIRVVANDAGTIDILTASGNSLVAGVDKTDFMVKKNPDNNFYYDVYIGNYNLTDMIGSGKIKGLLDARDTYLQGALDELNTLAASITKEFNLIHNAGFGLDGSTGNDLFTPLDPTVLGRDSNTGGALGTGSIYDRSLLTLDEYEIRFTGPATFSIYNVSTDAIVSSGNAYVSGNNIDFEGVRVVVTDDTAAPAAGDVFSVSTIFNAARYFSVDLKDAEKFAAATDPLALPGDNTNVLSMVNLRDSKVLANGGATFHSYYTGMLADIGTSTFHARTNYEAQEVVVGELEAYRDSISGVSLDEEGVNLIKFQHAYTAAAKVIQVVDSMFEILVSIK